MDQWQATKWWMSFKATNNRKFLPLFFCQKRYLVLMGGGGSGKSIFAGRKVLERCATESGHRFLVCRKVARTLRDSCYAQLVGQANQFYKEQLAACNRGELRIRFTNGSEILFAGLDDVEKLKSIYDITGIWIEEASEVLESDFNQLDIRLRTDCKYYKQIIISFNPISVNHWLKKRFFDQKNPDAKVCHSTYKDNPFLPPESVKTLENFKDSDPYFYDVYCLGLWGVTGKTIFNARAVQQRLQENIQPIKTGYFAYEDDGLRIGNIQWIEDEKNGYIRIYQEPEEGKAYVIGGDTAGEGSDQFIGQVIDCATLTQRCTLRADLEEGEYARQMYCLGMMYNRALVAVEANFSTYPIRELERLRYPNQFVRMGEDSYTHKPKQSYGFKTTSVTRPLIIAGMVEWAKEIEKVQDKDTLEEMLTFVRNEKMRAEAEEGSHDDCVMALAIAIYAAQQQPQQDKKPTKPKAKWTEDMYEDYYNSSVSQKQRLIERWGDPF